MVWSIFKKDKPLRRISTDRIRYRPWIRIETRSRVRAGSKGIPRVGRDDEGMVQEVLVGLKEERFVRCMYGYFLLSFCICSCALRTFCFLLAIIRSVLSFSLPFSLSRDLLQSLDIHPSFSDLSQVDLASLLRNSMMINPPTTLIHTQLFIVPYLLPDGIPYALEGSGDVWEGREGGDDLGRVERGWEEEESGGDG